MPSLVPSDFKVDLAARLKVDTSAWTRSPRALAREPRLQLATGPGRPHSPGHLLRS